MSAVTSARKVGAALGIAVLGPASTENGAWVSNAGANVPEVVIGDPETVLLKIVPSPVIATEVTPDGPEVEV